MDSMNSSDSMDPSFAGSLSMPIQNIHKYALIRRIEDDGHRTQTLTINFCLAAVIDILASKSPLLCLRAPIFSISMIFVKSMACFAACRVAISAPTTCAIVLMVTLVFLNSD